ncbi:putative ribonuclease H-like domain-containing protein [Tanacetum coccineum]
MVPRSVLMKSDLVSINTARQNISKTAVLVNTARQVNVAHSKTTVNATRPMGKNINTARPKAVVNAVQGNNVNAVKASACWVWKPKTKVLDHGNPQMDLHDKGVIDSGYSRHMTGNMSYLTDYEEIDGGYVAFGGNPKGGKITGKGTIKTGNLDFENVYFLIDESQVLLRVPRKNNMYSVDLKNIVPKRGNLVRGLPSKLFENDQTCVACQKGKQYRASFVTDDYSRFTWGFFLATKDKTSGILKSFITRIENLVDHKVKVIRCDNGTEFKNREMNQFCKMKGILRQFSVARTPQQNGVAERRNRTLIEAARTMLADSKTPTLSFMRPFGCPITILNTIDHLGKFDGKADEGFFVGYSLNNKAFRVFNNRTRIVEETLHNRFSESTPNVAGSGPD